MLEGRGLVLRWSETLIRMLTFILVCHLLQFLKNYWSTSARMEDAQMWCIELQLRGRLVIVYEECSLGRQNGEIQNLKLVDQAF